MIDFEKEFQQYIKAWLKDNGFGEEDYDVLDDKLPDIYNEWLNIPSPVFGGKTPATFFDSVDSSLNLFNMLKKYVFSKSAVPGPLLTRMVVLKTEIYPVLIKELKRNESKDIDSDRLIAHCVELINEMKMPHPMDDYIRYIKSAEIESESSEAMIKVLLNNIETIKDDIKAAYLVTNTEYAKDSFLDILSELKNDDDAYKYILDCFLNDVSKSGMYAHMLSKTGNNACGGYLKDRMKDPSTDYFNFCAIKEALEELGEESDIDREFSGDKDFEYLSEFNNEEETDENLKMEDDFDE